ncbi:MAG: alpha/beta fold hydrolase, partial [Flavobacteriaceae bacterium]
QDMVNYCRENGIEAALVLGHSMGGKTVMNLACSFPNLIRAFVVADIAPKTYSPHHQQILNGLANLNFNQMMNRNDADNQLSKYVPDTGTRMFLLKNLHWVEPGKLGLRLNIEVLKNASHTIGQGLNSKMMSNHPCLFVKGANSEYILDSDVPMINYHFPNAEHRTIPNVGHWLHAEKPKLFFSIVTEWLQAQLRSQ